MAAEEVAAKAQVKRTLEQEKIASLYSTTDEKGTHNFYSNSWS